MAVMVVAVEVWRGSGMVVTIPAEYGIADARPGRHLDDMRLGIRCHGQRGCGSRCGIRASDGNDAADSSGCEQFLSQVSHDNSPFDVSRL